MFEVSLLTVQYVSSQHYCTDTMKGGACLASSLMRRLVGGEEGASETTDGDNRIAVCVYVSVCGTRDLNSTLCPGCHCCGRLKGGDEGIQGRG